MYYYHGNLICHEDGHNLFNNDWALVWDQYVSTALDKVWGYWPVKLLKTVSSHLMVAEHIFHVHFYQCYTECTKGLRKTNMMWIQWSCYLLNACAICNIFSSQLNTVFVVSVFCHKVMLQEVTIQRTRQFSAISFFITKRIQLNATQVNRKIVI